VYRTIVKKFTSYKGSEEQKRAKESRKSLKRLKKSAHEVKSAPEDKVLLKMMTSSEAEVHQKQVTQKQPHQKLKIQDLTVQMLSIGFESNVEDWK
jgi:hypothetical protein